jgi:hypothetical protein
MAIKIRQFPAIMRDRTPKFSVDEICTPATVENFVIFAMTGAWGIGADTFMLFALLKDMNINIVLVVNGKLNEKDISKAKRYVHRILIRKNLGRDFGAFRAATLKFYEEKISCKHVIYLNDSVYYLKRETLKKLIGSFIDDNSPFDMVAATENQEFSHHFSSFALSLTKEVFYDELIQKYWQSYRPYSLRIHAIRAGERKLSKLIKKRNYTVNVIYGLEKLSIELNKLSLEELLNTVFLLPSNRHPMKSSIFKGLSDALNAKEALFNNMRMRPYYLIGQSGDSHFSTSELSFPAMNDSFEKEIKIAIEKYIGVDNNILRLTYLKQVIEYFGNSSQVHLAWGFFNKFLNIPFLKKDLFYRDIFLEYELPFLLDGIDETERAYILRMQIGRGRCEKQSDISEIAKRYLKLV